MLDYVLSHVLDVDECSDGNSMCDANEYCVNNPGSFTCSGTASYFVDFH